MAAAVDTATEVQPTYDHMATGVMTEAEEVNELLAMMSRGSRMGGSPSRRTGSPSRRTPKRKQKQLDRADVGPGWNSTPHRNRPIVLRGQKSVTDEPWKRSEQLNMDPHGDWEAAHPRLIGSGKLSSEILAHLAADERKKSEAMGNRLIHLQKRKDAAQRAAKAAAARAAERAEAAAQEAAREAARKGLEAAMVEQARQEDETIRVEIERRRLEAAAAAAAAAAEAARHAEELRQKAEAEALEEEQRQEQIRVEALRREASKGKAALAKKLKSPAKTPAKVPTKPPPAETTKGSAKGSAKAKGQRKKVEPASPAKKAAKGVG